jgi:hypothetical protein
MTHSFLLGCGGLTLGQQIEDFTQGQGAVVKIMVNALVLYAALVLLPWTSVTGQLQNTLPGIVGCTALFARQTIPKNLF